MTMRGAAIALAIVLASGQSLRAQGPDEMRQRLAEAIAALDATETERGVDLLRALLASAPITTPRDLLVAAHLRLAEASWALELRDSATAHLREAVRLDPSLEPDGDLFNPVIMNAYRAVRLTTGAIRLTAPADTTLVPGQETFPVTIAVGEPGRVTLRLRMTQPRVRDSVVASVEVDGTASFAMNLGTPGVASLVAGTYGLEGEITSAGGESVRHLVQLDIEALSVDTMPHEPPPAASLFRPETRTGAPSLMSFARAVGLGAAATALPALVTDRDLGARRVPIGVAFIGISVTIAEVLLARPDVPIPANVDYNRTLRADWVARNESIAAGNDRRRRAAPVRIRTGGAR